MSTPDEELRWRFKNEIGSIRKKAEQALVGLVGALVKYHHRRAERLRNKLRKLEQYKSRRNRNTVTKQTSHQKTKSPARKKTVKKDDDVNELSEELKTKISDVLLEQVRSQVCANKQSEYYSCLLSDSLEVRGKGKANRRDNKASKNQSCPILSHCYGPLRAVDGSCAHTERASHYDIRAQLRFVRSVRSVRIVTVRMLRAVNGSYAPYKPSELLTVRILSTCRALACISLWHQGTVCCRFVRSVRSVRIVTVRMLDWYGPY